MKNNTRLELITLFVVSAGGLLVSPAWAGNEAEPVDIKGQLAHFFGVDEKRIGVECPQMSFSLAGQGEDETLNVCLKRSDGQRRCEVTVGNLERDSQRFHLSYEFKLSDRQSRSQWNSIMQMHSFPDKGEAWRCPPLSLEVMQGDLRMFNRWDSSAISKTSGNNCTEPGSSIESRNVLSGIPAPVGEWVPVELMGVLSYGDQGELAVKLGPKEIPTQKGPNTYNDERAPYFKFGVYKPTSWDDGQQEVCVSYRRVKLASEPR